MGNLSAPRPTGAPILGSARGGDGDPTLRRLAVLGAHLITIRSLVGASTVWLLPVSTTTRWHAALIFAATAAQAVASLLLPWGRLPRRALLLYPAVGVSGLAALGVLTTGVGPTYAGFLVFVFLYAGTTGSARGVLALLVPCAATWTLLNGLTHSGMTATLGVRLAIAVSVWSVTGLLLARRTEQEHHRRSELTNAARTDPLTGLGNRRSLEQILTNVQPGDTVIAVDLDAFRDINTTRGHSGGDTVLAEFGQTLRVGLRGGDSAIRLGGDEFVLILTGVSDIQVLTVLNRLRDQWQHRCGPVTFSAGAATVQPNEPGHDALHRADQHCYLAKEHGRDQWVLDEPIPAAT